jgi:hypothetical protein
VKKVEELRHYGKAFSDAEGAWPDDVRARMKKRAMKEISANIPWSHRPRFAWYMIQGKRRAAELELDDLRENGMTNARFLSQQLDYLAAFWALVQLYDSSRAVEIMTSVMDKSAREPMLYCLPEPDAVREVGEPMEVFRDYLRPSQDAASEAGCNEIQIAEDRPGVFEFHVTWCIWLELAERMGIPEACLPNCYSDDVIFPEYFEQLGITYSRSGTLARGCACCDFRFEAEQKESEA